VKVDVDGFDAFREIIDRGVGSIVAAHITIGKQFHAIRVSYLVDLDAMRVKLATEGADLGVMELSLYDGWRPGGKHARPGDNENTLVTTAMVARVMKKIDKKGGEMAFLGLLCADGQHREALCFASSWPDFAKEIQQGVIAKFKLSKDKKTLILDNDVSDAVSVLE
jgi:hypothetical protein